MITDYFKKLGSLARKPELSENNHMKFKKSYQKGELFFASYVGELSRAPENGFQEGVHAAQKIYESRRGLPIQLCLSGGVDSEAMAEAFVAAEVPFTAYFMRFEDQLNEFDIKTNVEFCESNRIPYKYIDINIKNFFESGEFLSYGQKYECQSPQLASHLWLADQLDGLPVFGGNPFTPAAENNQWFYVGLPGDLHSVGFRYFERTNRQGVPWFFTYTPEFAASFWKTDVIKDFARDQKSKEDYTYSIKCDSYQQAGFMAPPRLDKFTGFEAVRHHYDQIFGTQWGQGFDEHFRKPLEKLNPFPDHYYQLVPKSFFDLVL